MTSPAKIQANLANAQHSTGPRSPEGKARSSQNARKHGLTAKDLVILPGEQEDFEDLLTQLTSEVGPEGTLEQITFNSLVHAAWNLRRCRRAEAELAASGADPLLDEESGKKMDRISRYSSRAERSYYRALKELKDLQTMRAPRSPVQKEAIPALTHLPAVQKEATRNVDHHLDAMLRALDAETELFGSTAYQNAIAQLPGLKP